MNMLFAETLKKLRTEKGLSQNEIAKRMYVTRVTVSRWESGNRLPDAAMIYRLSEVLGADINIPIVGLGDHGWYLESHCGALGHRPPLLTLLRGSPQSPVKEVQSSKE